MKFLKRHKAIFAQQHISHDSWHTNCDRAIVARQQRGSHLLSFPVANRLHRDDASSYRCVATIFLLEDNIEIRNTLLCGDASHKIACDNFIESLRRKKYRYFMLARLRYEALAYDLLFAFHATSLQRKEPGTCQALSFVYV